MLYVLPNSSSNESCSFQPCATLSQYLLDNNGTLPVVSNVEYHLLPGEHHLPTNMTLQYLIDFAIVGNSLDALLSAVLVIDFRSSIKIFNSVNVTITHVVFKTSDIHVHYVDKCNVVLSDCLSCSIIDVAFLSNGFCGKDLGGKSYLSNITMDFTSQCYTGIDLKLSCEEALHNECIVILDRIFINGTNICSKSNIELKFGIFILFLSSTGNNISLVVNNSQFQNMGQKVIHIIRASVINYICRISIENSRFEMNHDPTNSLIESMFEIELSYSNVALTISNCYFFGNYWSCIILINAYKYDQHMTLQDTCCAILSNITIASCSFIGNGGRQMDFQMYGSELLTNINIYFTGHNYLYSNSAHHYHDYENIILYSENFIIHINGQFTINRNLGKIVIKLVSSNISFNQMIDFSNNIVDQHMLSIHKGDVLFNGAMIISNNEASIMQMYSCNVIFNASVKIFNNWCNNNNYDILQFQYCQVLVSKNISITSNQCENIIMIKSYQDSAYIEVMDHSNITFNHNHYSNLISVETDPIYGNPYPLCLFQYVALSTQQVILPSYYSIVITEDYTYNCKLTFYHFISHCKWITTAVFCGSNPKAINQQIIHVNHKLNYSTIFFCSSFSVDTLGPVYPEQMLQVELCMPCSDNHTSTVLYAETHNTLLPESACKIAHQTELVNFITSNSKMVSYTIVSAANDSCELFLTVSPFLYYIYEVFDVYLLPCPIGFTLQNGVCDCDPLLPTDIDTCYIDQSAIRRPVNIWISYTQSGTSKYLISDCPMDYCLPFSSNVNLLYPDTQCQFNRTGILCSQCQHPLSMVFGSSRCMKCTNVHILITIIVIVAGI